MTVSGRFSRFIHVSRSRFESAIGSSSNQSTYSSSSSIRIFAPIRHGSSLSPRHRWRRSIPIGTATIVSLSAVGIALKQDSIWEAQGLQEEGKGKSKGSLESAPVLSLLRSYFVWTILGLPLLVDSSPAIMDSLLHTSIPGVSTITEFFVRATFFAQFIPGETALECAPVMDELRERNVGSALNYCAEADTDPVESANPERVELARFHEVEKALDVQGALEQKWHLKGWTRGSSAFALKVTGLIDPAVLVRASNTLHRIRSSCQDSTEALVPYPGCPCDRDAELLVPSSNEVSHFNKYQKVVPRMGVGESDDGVQPGDMEKIALLWQRLDSLSERARRNGVRLIFDAEESYYEPVIDGYLRILSKKYNHPYTVEGSSEKDSIVSSGPVIYGSYQCYLARQPAFLAAAIRHAEANKYSLGLKLIRGGYIVKEQNHVQDTGNPDGYPIWPNKESTDAAYNGSIETILKTLSKQLAGENRQTALSVIFGTHNTESLDHIFQTLEAQELASRTAASRLRIRADVKGKVGIAQLYGMRSDLSDKIAHAFEESKSPMSLIFIAYGHLGETLPFLSRRAVENKSLMTGQGGAAVERRRVGAELRRRLSFL